ncbi:MAG TPA: YceI family protein [Tepidisphaeraceae bacterium]|nr:YceI family protein [Tepidisphaeraceae bacterium]
MHRIASLIGLVVLSLGSSLMAQTSYKIDPVHSSTVFRIMHFGAGAVWGIIPEPTGAWTHSDNEITLDVTVEVAKINSGNAKRDEHLRNADFFNAPQFPVMTFKSTSSKPIDGGWEVTGDLTIKGRTKTITVPVKKLGEGADPRGTQRAGVEAEFTINRLEYGVDYMPGALGNDVRIIVALEGTKAE